MRHPEQTARLMRPRIGWKIEPGTTDHGAESFEDACMALAGSSPEAFAAFSWTMNGDTRARRQLEQHLAQLAARLSIPAGVDPAELVRLACDEQAAPAAQRRDDLRALVCGVSARDWHRLYRHPHARLLAEVDALMGDAWRTIKQRDDEAA